jgi:hypothetical protein
MSELYPFSVFVQNEIINETCNENLQLLGILVVIKVYTFNLLQINEAFSYVVAQVLTTLLD